MNVDLSLVKKTTNISKKILNIARKFFLNWKKNKSMIDQDPSLMSQL